jgi:hypothetical protein
MFSNPPAKENEPPARVYRLPARRFTQNLAEPDRLNTILTFVSRKEAASRHPRSARVS